MNLLSQACWLSALHRLRLAPRGSGKPVTAAAMDQAYRSGQWDLLDTPAERCRYESLARQVRNHWGGGAVLDVGCGQGRLLDFIAVDRLTSYTGIDLSPTALERGRQLHPAPCRFEVADFNQWRDSTLCDVVVFNESIGYAFNPVSTLARYRRFLRPTGVILISLFRSGNSSDIWQRIAMNLPLQTLPPLQTSCDRVWDFGLIPGPCDAS